MRDIGLVLPSNPYVFAEFNLLHFLKDLKELSKIFAVGYGKMHLRLCILLGSMGGFILWVFSIGVFHMWVCELHPDLVHASLTISTISFVRSVSYTSLLYIHLLINFTIQMCDPFLQCKRQLPDELPTRYHISHMCTLAGSTSLRMHSFLGDICT